MGGGTWLRRLVWGGSWGPRPCATLLPPSMGFTFWGGKRSSGSGSTGRSSGKQPIHEDQAYRCHGNTLTVVTPDKRIHENLKNTFRFFDKLDRSKSMVCIQVCVNMCVCLYKCACVYVSLGKLLSFV